MKLGLSGCSIALCFSLGESSLLFSWGELFTFMEGRVEENVLLRPIDIRGVLLICTPIVWVS